MNEADSVNGAYRLLAQKRVCVCVGAGGVGKTTVAAALALGMSARRLKVVVVTIDPARRLADALGVAQLSNQPTLVAATRADGSASGGELWAMMLDPKRTFDELIERLAPSPERAAAIKRNGIYRELSGAVSGSQEFTAIEKLYELAEQSYDLIVLDTPPARSAAEFLTAPQRLTAFLGGGAAQAWLRPNGIGRRLLGLSVAPLFSALRVLTGLDLISDLRTFFSLLGSMTDEFRLRAARVERLLRAPDTGFLLVTSAEGAPTDETITLAHALNDAGMTLLAAIVNRMHPPLAPGAVVTATERALPAVLQAKLRQAAADHTVLSERDSSTHARVQSALAPLPVFAVPELALQIHDLQTLAALERCLFADDQPL